eukprot:scaffold2.g7257.t1
MNANPPSTSGAPSAFSSPIKQTSAFGETPFRSPKSRVTYNDRFIPSRAVSSRLDYSILDREAAASEAPRRTAEREESNGAYNLLLRSELLGCPSAALSPDKGGPAGVATASPTKSPSRKLFRYLAGDTDAPTAGLPTQSPYARGPIGDDSLAASPLTSPSRVLRKIPRSPFKARACPVLCAGRRGGLGAGLPGWVLDAPALADDFYLNLVDWSAQNVLAVGLGSCVYLWSACTSKVTRLVDFGEQGAVCSVSWSQRGSYLSIGTDKGEVQIWDANRCKRIRTMPGHKQRVGCMSWSHHTLATGSRDRSILMRDVRSQEPYSHKLNGHRSEVRKRAGRGGPAWVCGLKWSPDDRELASGGNDNQLYIWSAASQAPLLRFTEHQAAVKAIAWSPHQHGLLCSGGGTADRHIRFWNTSTGAALHHVDTGSQVCNLSWSKNINELVSTHGYSQNQIIVWRYPTMQASAARRGGEGGRRGSGECEGAGGGTRAAPARRVLGTKLATLTGHTMRVLYLAVSPDGQTIVTGAGDETLRFWNVFPGPKSQGGGSDTGMGTMMRTLIR